MRATVFFRIASLVALVGCVHAAPWRAEQKSTLKTRTHGVAANLKGSLSELGQTLTDVAGGSWQSIGNLANNGNNLAIAIVSAWRTLEFRLYPASVATRAAMLGSRSVIRQVIDAVASPTHEQPLLTSWLALAASGLCGTASMAVAVLCALCGLCEVAACAGKNAASMLAVQLAAGASFGSLAPSIKEHQAGWGSEQAGLRLDLERQPSHWENEQRGAPYQPSPDRESPFEDESHSGSFGAPEDPGKDESEQGQAKQSDAQQSRNSASAWFDFQRRPKNSLAVGSRVVSCFRRPARPSALS